MRMKLRSRQELIKIKAELRQCYETIVTNILKIALKKREEKIACLITAYYEIKVDEEMLIKALSEN